LLKADSENQSGGGKGNSKEKNLRQAENSTDLKTLPAEALKRDRGMKAVPSAADKTVAPTPAVVADAKKNEAIVSEMTPGNQMKIEAEQPVLKKSQIAVVADTSKSGASRDEPGRIQLSLTLTPMKDQFYKAVPSGLPMQSSQEEPEKGIPQSTPQKVGSTASEPSKTGEELSKTKRTLKAGGVSPLETSFATEGQAFEEALARIQSLLLPLEGKILIIDRNKETQRPESLEIEIPVQNYRQFITELNEMGTLNKPVAEDGSLNAQTLRNKLQLMLPE
jgi:hypothetical protein